MRLARVGAPGQERPAALDSEGVLRDLSSAVPDISGPWLSRASLDLLRRIDLRDLPVMKAGRYAPCVGAVGKIVCVGLNYIDHAREAGFEPPSEPVLFLKATTSLSGAHDPIIPPHGSSKLDWELELGVVVGERIRQGAHVQGLEAVAGYCVFNDISERAFQLERGGQWTKGKSSDSFGPCGPWLVTADEIADPQALELRLSRNGELRQAASTADMIVGVADLMVYISGFMSLEPGDIIASGTPPGVGLGMEPQQYLSAGDHVEAEISRLGRQAQTVAPPRHLSHD